VDVIVVEFTTTMVVEFTTTYEITFNNISVLSWRAVLLVNETGVPGENHRPTTNH
jgi:hypothetical protein